MRGAWLLSLRHALHHRGQTVILVLCLAVPLFLPAATQVLIRSYEQDLEARSAATPLVAGAKGNRFDLTLAALYFRQSEIETVPYTLVAELARGAEGIAIPVHARFTARRHPLVGTSPEYYPLRRLAPAQGTIPLRLGDVAIGANVARELALAPGASLFSDQRELYEISKPPALKMRVSGVLGPTGGPDDDAVFVDVKTAWILEGLAHGHDDVETLPESYVLGRSERSVAVSQAMIEYHEVTDGNVASFHYHGDPSRLPLSAIIFVPSDAKAATLVKARINASKTWQMVVPVAVIQDLMAFVFRIKALFDTFSAVLGACMLLMTVLVLLLSMRLRRGEMETLNHMGCSRSMVARLHAYEFLLIVGASVVLAAGGTVLAWLLAPDLVRML